MRKICWTVEKVLMVFKPKLKQIFLLFYFTWTIFVDDLVPFFSSNAIISSLQNLCDFYMKNCNKWSLYAFIQTKSTFFKRVPHRLIGCMVDVLRFLIQVLLIFSRVDKDVCGLAFSWWKTTPALSSNSDQFFSKAYWDLVIIDSSKVHINCS